MKLTTTEAAILLPVLERILHVHKSSVVIASLIGIDKHEIKKVLSIVNRLKK